MWTSKPSKTTLQYTQNLFWHNFLKYQFQAYNIFLGDTQNSIIANFGYSVSKSWLRHFFEGLNKGCVLYTGVSYTCKITYCWGCSLQWKGHQHSISWLPLSYRLFVWPVPSSRFPGGSTVFWKQLALAVELKNMVVIHSRDAGKDCLQIAKEVLPAKTFIHVHVYIGNFHAMLMWTCQFPNAFIWITPVCTNKNEDLEEVARLIPLYQLVLKIDAPYFLFSGAPRPFKLGSMLRKSRNL